jgi:polar amino acid transport system substrate-binding protein
MTTTSSRLLRWALRGVLLSALLALPMRPALAQVPTQVLTIGRVGLDFESPLSDIAEEVMREASRRAGIELVFRRLPVLRSAEMANDGETDGDLARIVDVVARYPNLILVPTPISKFTVAIYAATPEITKMTRAEIRQLKIGTIRGVFTVIKHSRGLTVTDTLGTNSALDMLGAGRFDAAMLDLLDTETFIAKNHVTGLYRWPHAWAVEPMYLLLNRKHAALVPRLNEALLQMKREGLIDKAFSDTLRRHRIEPLKPD